MIKIRNPFPEFVKEMDFRRKPQFDHNFNETFTPLHEHIIKLCRESHMYAIDIKEIRRIFKQVDNGGDELLSVDEI